MTMRETVRELYNAHMDTRIAFSDTYHRLWSQSDSAMHKHPDYVAAEAACAVAYEAWDEAFNALLEEKRCRGAKR